MEQELCTAEFALLPAHIITQILGYLKLDDFKNASSICKSWHYASTDPQIARTLILQPTEDNFPEICKSNRRYGVLKLHFLEFDKVDRYYFELFEKFCPFIYELHIIDSDLKIHHLLKLFELTTCLEKFSFSECYDCGLMTGLFPLDYDGEAKKRAIQNLSGIKNIVIEQFINIPLITDLVRCATNLDTFEFSNEYLEDDGCSYQELCTIFDNDNIGNLKHLNLHLNFSHSVDEFLTSFVNIKNLNLKSFRIVIWWIWEGTVYKSSIFRSFIMKLNTLEDFSIFGLRQNQLFLICQIMVNLKSLDCLLDSDQPISELTNLKQLEKLCCRFSQHTFISLHEIDKFFKCKFEYLRLFNFEEFVTESNLVQLCENHPNLIELKVTRLLTRNLEIIFKHLTKLRVLTIYFGFIWLKTRPDINDLLQDVALFDLEREYDYKISRLQDLEEFHLGQLVNGVTEDDVRQLKKLRLTNLPALFSNKTEEFVLC